MWGPFWAYRLLRMTDQRLQRLVNVSIQEQYQRKIGAFCEKDSIIPEGQQKGKRFMICIFLAMLVMGLLLYWNLFRNKPLILSSETCIITEPRTEDGRYIDYRRWYLENHYSDQGIDTDQNGLRTLLLDFGFPSLDELDNGYDYSETGENRQICENEKKGIYRQFQLDISTPPQYKLPEEMLKYDEYLKEKYPGEKNVSIREDKAGRHPLEVLRKGEALADPDAVQWWLDRNSPALDVAAKAIAKDLFIDGLNPLVKYEEHFMLCITYTPFITHFRILMNSFALRIEFRIARGEITQAVDDLVTLAKLQRHIFQENKNWIYFSVFNTLGQKSGACGK